MTTMGERMTEEEVDHMMKVADENKDGKIQYKEFAKMMAPK